MKIEFKDVMRFPRKMKKQMKKENRYTTKTEYIEDYKERISMIQVGVEWAYVLQRFVYETVGIGCTYLSKTDNLN